jgi:type IV pilus assembly protein PilA
VIALGRRATRSHDEGFTLVELLVVMIVIGILAAIAVPIYLMQRQRGNEASVKSDLRAYARELETYSSDYQAYPAVASFAQATNGALAVAPGMTVRVSKGNTFGYYLNSAKTAFCLVAVSSSGGRPLEFISSQGGLQRASTFASGTTLPPACSTSSY